MNWNDIGLGSITLAAMLAVGIIAYLAGRRKGRRDGQIEFDNEVQGAAQAKVNRVLHDANRATLPRHDTAGPAKVHRATPGRKPQHRRKS